MRELLDRLGDWLDERLAWLTDLTGHQCCDDDCDDDHP